LPWHRTQSRRTENAAFKRRRIVGICRRARCLPRSDAANFCRLLLLTSARSGEALAATGGQFDLDAGLRITPNKSAFTSCPCRVQPSRCSSKYKTRHESARVFPRRIDRRHWKRICKAAGIIDLRIHDSRHIYASLLINEGAGLPVIGKLLGHTRAETTFKYAHLADSLPRAATENVGRIVSAQKPTRKA
jgi:integrase